MRPAFAASRKRSKRSRRAIGNEAASIQASLDFHTAVAVAAGNQTLLLTTRLLRSLYFESTRFSRRHLENYVTLLADHEDILTAIRNRDPKAAAAASENHMRHGLKIVLDSGEIEDVGKKDKERARPARANASHSQDLRLRRARQS